MKQYLLFVLSSFFIVSSTVPADAASQVHHVCCAREPKNLSLLKHEIVSYYTCGDYEADVLCLADAIISYTKSRLPLPENAAVVFDIDDTVLCNFEFNQKQDFGYNPSHWNEWEKSSNSPAIKPMLRVYHFLRQHGVKTFFVTGRRPHLRQATELNLINAGFFPWDGVYFRPDDYATKSRIPFKARMRRFITRQGYTIIMSIGDQYSDLLGGYAEKTFKLPNPLYYIP